MTCDAHTESSSPALWEAAKSFLRRLYAVCGGPCALVAEAHLSLKERREITHWLRPVEALVRRLLVFEAARIAKTLPLEGTSPRRPVKRSPPAGHRARLPDPEDSAAWTVRFCSREASEPAGRGKAAPGFQPRILAMEVASEAGVLAPARLARAVRRFHQCREERAMPAPARADSVYPKPRRRAGSPWPLARRVEAVTRILRNPAPYARRLARRLRERPELWRRACRLSVLPRAGRWPPPGEAAIRHAEAYALQVLAAFDTS